MNFFSQKNRILLKELIKTDFKLRYQGSFIGYLWSILKPLMMFTIMYLVFVRFLRFDDGTPHYAVGLLLAMIFWGFFTEATNMGMLSIVSRGDLLRKLNFPKQTIVISSVLGAAINFLINLVVVFVFALINHVPIGFNTLVIIPLFIEVLLMAMGVAFILSALFVKYRDIGPVWEVVLQAGMYASPIIYSITYLLQRNQEFVAKIMMLNPIAQILQDMRHFIIDPVNPRGWDIINNKLIATEASQSLRTTLVNRFKGIKGYTEQHVLKDISFEVEKGDFYGIVGRNGSGKSTLLKIISEIYVPEKGKVTIDGKLVSFIELGVGFNPELTGRENVYMNGAMLGFSTEEVDAMYDDIVDFAELHDFMNQKLKNYSSGMQVRLAFSVAIKAQGDILILDEVLAVGDEAFQRKCNDYFMERKQSGKTTILVTHDMSAVKKYCNKAVLIEHGLVKVVGDPDEVANQYSFDNAAGQKVSNDDVVVENPKITDLQVKLLNDNIISPDQDISFEISYDVNEDIETYIAFSLTDIDRGIWIYNDNSIDNKTSGSGRKTLTYKCSLSHLNNIKLKLQVSVRDKDDQMIAFADSENSPVILLNRTDIEDDDKSAKDSATGMVQRNGKWEIQE